MSKAIFITGASSGIGKATASLFQKQGWNVVATMRSPEKEVDLVKLDDVLVTQLDVTKPDTSKSAVATAQKQFGSIDVLVNNTGYGAFGALEAFSDKRIERQFNTNMIGLLAVTRAVLPIFRTQRSGIIVNMSSKGFLKHFPSNWPRWGGIKLIEPGMIKSDFFSEHPFDFAEEDNAFPEYEETSKKFTATMA